MSRVVIIADDLTGANATGVLLARSGYKTGTFLNLDQITTEQLNDYEVISLTTDSRALPINEAYIKVKQSAQAMVKFGADLFSKRIDTTLRGNIGSEIDAMLDALGSDTVAVVVAAFPSSGRITVGGYLIVNSVPLEKTFAAKDPKTPVNKSIVTEIVAQQSKYEIGSISLETVLKSSDKIASELLTLKEAGKRIIVIDAATQGDLDQIAYGVRKSGLKVVTVDPGPFTEAIARHLLPERQRHTVKKVLMVVGSVTPLVREQLNRLEARYDSYFAYADAIALISNSELEIERVSQEILLNTNNHQILGIRTIKFDGDILDIENLAESLNLEVDQVSNRIATGLAKITKVVMEQTSGTFGAMYTSGGDTTVAVCHEIGAIGIEVKDEVIPLAAFGRVIGGPFNNLALITKGGLVGDEDAISTCVEYLLERIP